MEENTQQPASETSPKSSNPMMYIVVVIVIILAVGGGWYAYKKMTKTTQPPAMPVAPTQPAMQQDNSMKATSAPTMPMGSPSAMDNAVQKITVTGSNFKFTPSTITVKKGQKVEITFVSTGSMHNFNIDELQVKTATIPNGQTTTIDFTPDKTGTFDYYCSVGNHRAMGMQGKITVE